MGVGGSTRRLRKARPERLEVVTHVCLQTYLGESRGGGLHTGRSTRPPPGLKTQLFFDVFFIVFFMVLGSLMAEFWVPFEHPLGSIFDDFFNEKTG